MGRKGAGRGMVSLEEMEGIGLGLKELPFYLLWVGTWPVLTERSLSSAFLDQFPGQLAQWLKAVVLKAGSLLALLSLTDRGLWKLERGIRKQLEGETNKSSSPPPGLYYLHFLSESWFGPVGKLSVGYCGFVRVPYLLMRRALGMCIAFVRFLHSGGSSR